MQIRYQVSICSAWQMYIHEVGVEDLSEVWSICGSSGENGTITIFENSFPAVLLNALVGRDCSMVSMVSMVTC